jgi:hypothetical protein
VTAPSVALRFCLASEEIVRLAGAAPPNEADRASPPRRAPPDEALGLLAWFVEHARKLADANEDDRPTPAFIRTTEAFDRKWKEFKRDWPTHRFRWQATLLAIEMDEICSAYELPPRVIESEEALDEILNAATASNAVKTAASAKLLVLQAGVVENEDDFKVWQAGLLRHLERYSNDVLELELHTLRLELAKEHAPSLLPKIVAELLEHENEDVRRSAERFRKEVKQ